MSPSPRQYTTGDGLLVIATPSPSRGNPGEVQFSVKIKDGAKVVDSFTLYRHAGLDYTAKQRGWKRV